MPRKSIPKTKSVRKPAKTSMLPLLGGGTLVALAFLITISLQSTMLSTSSSARVVTSCGASCNDRNPCSDGLSCIDRKCTCNSGNCIQGKCILPKGTAELGQECDVRATSNDRRGKESILRLACKEGLQCLAIATMNGNISVCCDPQSPDYPANCIVPDLRVVAPKP